jgi:hypothetical protein
MVTFSVAFCLIGIMLTAVAEFLSPITGWYPLLHFGWIKPRQDEEANRNTVEGGHEASQPPSASNLTGDATV